MPTMIRAHETTANVPSGRNKPDIREGIMYLDPDAAPLINFTTEAGRRKKVAKNPRFQWNEKGLAPKQDRLNGALTTGDTAVIVDNGAYFGVGDLVKFPPTGEVVRVTAVSSNTLTVTRSWGAAAADDIADDTDVLIIGNAFAEGAAKPAVRSHQETTPYNFTEIFRHTFGETRTQQNTDTYIDGGAGNGRKRLRMEKAIEHKLDIERAFLFGDRVEDASDTNAPIRSTGGLLYFATSNNKAAGAVLTEAEIEDWLEDVFQYTGGSDTRLLLASPKVISVLDQIAASRMQVVSDRNLSYGVAVKTWITGHGNLIIAKHRLFTDGAGGAGYSGYAFAVDPKKLAYRHIANSDTMLNKNIEDNGDDRWTDEYLTECGLEINNPETAGVLTGVVA